MRTDTRAARGGADNWARTNAVFWVGVLMVASACSSGPTAPSSSSSLSVGRWVGTTAQGSSITFTVSSDEILTTIALGYTFNGCSGTQTFSNLSVRTAPEVICIPGPCSGTITSYRSFSFSDGSSGSGPVTAVNGLFLVGGQAQGQVAFQDFPGCGTATSVAWSATRR